MEHEDTEANHTNDEAVETENMVFGSEQVFSRAQDGLAGLIRPAPATPTTGALTSNATARLPRREPLLIVPSGTEIYTYEVYEGNIMVAKFKTEGGEFVYTVNGLNYSYPQELPENELRELIEMTRVNRGTTQSRPDRWEQFVNFYDSSAEIPTPESSSRQRRRRDEDMTSWRNRLNENNQQNNKRINELNQLLPENQRYTNLCDFCGKGVNERKKDTYFVVDNACVCISCLRNNFRRCDECERFILNGVQLNNTDGECLCPQCANEKFPLECECCLDRMRKDDKVDEPVDELKGWQVCSSCDGLVNSYQKPAAETNGSHEGYGEIAHRAYCELILPKFCSKKPGTIVKSLRYFSAELECIYRSLNSANALIDKLPLAIGVAHDGSIRDNNDQPTTGVEVQTPKLQGENGEKLIAQLCDKLNAAEFKTNKTCGFHIHLDAKDFLPERTGEYSGDALRTLFAFYVVFEDVIHSFLPRSRRLNQYCKPLRNEYRLSEIIASRSFDELEKAWYKTSTKLNVEASKRGRDPSRYSGINLHTLLSEGHLEVRYHSGTTNSMKILEWVNLHTQIMDRVADGSINRVAVLDAMEETDVETKAMIFFELLELPNRSRKYFKSRQLRFKDTKRLEEHTITATYQPNFS